MGVVVVSQSVSQLMGVYGAAYVVCDIGCSGVSSVVMSVVMSESVSCL